MEIRVLGCAGTVSTETKTSAYLVNGKILLDAGTVCSALDFEEQKQLKKILISHPHFDHIKGLPTLAENLIFMKTSEPVTIYGSEMTIDAIRRHVMNGVIWPDFSKLPSKDSPVLQYEELKEKQSLEVDGVAITPCFLFKNFCDFGYFLDDGNSSLLYTSDIGADAELSIGGRVPDSIIIEVSFPDENRELALMTGHLTPGLMMEMIEKLPEMPKNIFVSHFKTYFKKQIIDQLNSLGIPNLKILSDGDVLKL